MKWRSEREDQLQRDRKGDSNERTSGDKPGLVSYPNHRLAPLLYRARSITSCSAHRTHSLTILALRLFSRAMSSSSPAAPPPVRILIGTHLPTTASYKTLTDTLQTVGTGAVGAFYGSRLALAPNTTVSVTCRSNYAAVRDSGLTLNTHSFGSYHFKPHSIHPSITSAAQSSPYDYILLATKALPDLINDAELLQPLLTDSPSTSIVLVQNGVGIEQPHRLLFPQNPILSAVAMANAAQTSPGTIKQNRWTRISLGPFVGKQGDEELRRRSERETKRFVRLLKEGGIEDAEEYDEKGMQLVRWHKLAVGFLASFLTRRNLLSCPLAHRSIAR